MYSGGSPTETTRSAWGHFPSMVVGNELAQCTEKIRLTKTTITFSSEREKDFCVQLGNRIAELQGEALVEYLRKEGLARISSRFPSDTGINFIWDALMSEDRLSQAGHLGSFAQTKSAKQRRDGLLKIRLGHIPVRQVESGSDDDSDEDEIEEGAAADSVSKSVSKVKQKKVSGNNQRSKERETQARLKQTVPAAQESDSLQKLVDMVKNIDNRMQRIEQAQQSESPLGKIGEVIKNRGAISDSDDTSSSSSSDSSTVKTKKRTKSTYTPPAVKKRRIGERADPGPGLMVGFEGLTSSIAEQDKIALSNIKHRVHKFGNISRSITEGSWADPQGKENRRNKYEALSLARGLDLDISTLGQEGTARLPSAEVRIRRIVALERATSEGSWKVAQILEETFQGYDPETNRALKEAIKLKKSIDGTSEKDTSRSGKRPSKQEKKE